jgi:hypothetical protein
MKNSLSNAGLLKGVLATMFGLILIIATYGIIFRMLVFTVGLMLLHRGVQTLNPAGLDQIVKMAKKWLKVVMAK